MTTFNKSEIMKEAWENFRSPFLFKGITGRARFAKCLKAAWNYAKRMVESAAIKLFYQKQAIARATMNQVDLLREEISLLQFKSSRINIADRRVQLEAQIEALAA